MTAALLLCANVAHADGPFDFQQGERASQARRMRTAGITLTATGVAAATVTIVLWGLVGAHGAGCGLGLPCNDPPGSVAGIAVGAIATTGLSGALLGSGIPLWAVGQSRLRGPTQPRQPMNAALSR